MIVCARVCELTVVVSAVSDRCRDLVSRFGRVLVSFGD